MKLDHTKPEKYRNRSGKKIVAITELKIPNDGDTHLIHYEGDDYEFWGENESFLEEIPDERWQGLFLGEKGELSFCNSHGGVGYSIYNSFEELPSGFNAGYNLDTLEIRKR